jgi:DNA-binding transcriptional MerR regulator
MPSEETFNISDVSQQTGVAAVTLRAWERRYGLIKPLRTAKGHRLYSQGNIQQIQQILSWLNRGVAISKVTALLTNEQTPAAENSNENQWLQTQQDLLAAITQLKQRSLNPLLDQLNKTTPFITLCEHVYQPLEILLLQRWQQQPLGYQLEQQLWEQCWQRQSLIMTLRADKQKTHSNCYFINLDKGRPSLDYWLFHTLLLQAGVRVNALNAINDLAGLTRLNNNVELPLILFADQRLEQTLVNQLPKLSTTWQESILCAGRMSDIHREQLNSLSLDCVGGSASDCWHSAELKAWLAKIKQ